jgi:hypothetical protein
VEVPAKFPDARCRTAAHPFVEWVTEQHPAAPHHQEPDMSATLTIPTPTRTTAAGRITWARALATGAVAAAAVTAIAAAFAASGHPLSLADGAIPVLSFGQMVLVAVVLGTVLARRLSRAAFLRTAIVLTALSCVPDLALGASALDAAGLVLTHLVAAAIVVPRLARR